MSSCTLRQWESILSFALREIELYCVKTRTLIMSSDCNVEMRSSVLMAVVLEMSLMEIFLLLLSCLANRFMSTWVQ